MAKISRPVLYTVIVGVIAYAAVVLTEPDTPAARAPAKRIVSKSSTAKATEFIPEDYTAHFASLNEPAKNAFKPLIIRKSALMAGESRNPNGIPGLFTGGDPNWAYTGLVEVNGEKMALLENSTTGEGVYLRRGDHWKGSTIKSIDDESLAIIGPDGSVRKVQLGVREKESEPPATTTETEVVPVQPTPPSNLQGEIGMNVTDRPGVPATKKG